MIQYNNQNSFKEIHYNGHDIQKAYCDTGDLVWQKQSPGPTPFDGKFKLTLSDSSTVTAECDSTSAISQNEVSALYESTLVSAEIGSCVTSIGDSAFNSCTSLTNVNIPSGVTSIGNFAFQSCSSLTNVNIPSGVTSIGNYAFYECSGLTSIDIPNSVVSIGESAFYNCTSLTSIVIPNSVTSIGGAVFNGCRSLTSCTIGDNVTTIGYFAFFSCSGLTGVTIEATTPPTLGNYAFYNTNNCPIYVPSASVETYKSASDWSDVANRIQAIPNS